MEINLWMLIVSLYDSSPLPDTIRFQPAIQFGLNLNIINEENVYRKRVQSTSITHHDPRSENNPRFRRYLANTPIGGIINGRSIQHLLHYFVLEFLPAFGVVTCVPPDTISHYVDEQNNH